MENQNQKGKNMRAEKTGKKVVGLKNGKIEILLSKGKTTIIDDDDYDKVTQFSWHLSHGGYAVRNARINGKYENQGLHRFIFGLTSKNKERIDHINGDKLNNSKSNLRICSHSENLMNRGKNKKTRAKYKGVIKRGYNSWVAMICVNYKSKYIGCFYTEEAAAYAYNLESKKLHGEFAYQNVVNKVDLKKYKKTVSQSCKDYQARKK